jgi:hypothetical protein
MALPEMSPFILQTLKKESVTVLAKDFHSDGAATIQRSNS